MAPGWLAAASAPLYQNNQNLPVNFVQSVSYGVAGEPLHIVGNSSAGYGGESRTYNSLFQVTLIQDQVFSGISMQYTYNYGSNIGKISKQKNLLSGEEVQYQYDSLGRMVSAATTGPDWGYSYTYDGFGNLTAKSVTKGTPTAGFSQGANPVNNHLSSGAYDANGNLLSYDVGYSYDVENRLTAYGSVGTGEQYGYDPSNKRIQKQLADGTEEIHFYGPNAIGRRIYPVV